MQEQTNVSGAIISKFSKKNNHGFKIVNQQPSQDLTERGEKES